MESKFTPNKDKSIFALAHCDYIQSGLNKREHFAIEVLKELCVNAGRNGYSLSNPEKMAKDATKLADALLISLESKEENNN